MLLILEKDCREEVVMKDVLKSNFTVACLTVISIVSILMGSSDFIGLWIIYVIYKFITW
jgi:hypothetical protein